MSLYSKYLQVRLFKLDWLFFLICLIFFTVFPDVDMVIAQLTWHPDAQFEYANLSWVKLSYLVFSKIHFVYLLGLIYLVVVQTFWKNSRNRLRMRAGFLLMALILGPGLVVNQLFKENWGRARPREVVAFGGSNQYTPPLKISKECDGNCSFVSGHAAGAFFILTLSWVFRNRRWLWLGLASGALVGAGRVLQGGHFFSDVVFSFWAVYASSLVCAIYFGMRAPAQANMAQALSVHRPLFK